MREKLDLKNISADVRSKGDNINKDEKTSVARVAYGLGRVRDELERSVMERELREIRSATKKAPGTREKHAEKSSAPIPEIERETQELKEARLMIEIAANGSIGMCASMPVEYSGGSGFHESVDDQWKMPVAPGKSSLLFARENQSFFGLNDRKMKDVYDKEKIREFIGLSPVMEDTYSEVDVPVQQRRLGGLLGSKTVTEKKMQKTGERQLLHSEAVKNGKEEPLFKLRYSVRCNSSDHGDMELKFADENGRPGNILIIDILLPQSTAQKTIQELKKNPRLIRRITESLITKRFRIEKFWKKNTKETITSSENFTLRPPYEAWDEAGENFYFVEDPRDGYEFNPQKVGKGEN